MGWRLIAAFPATHEMFITHNFPCCQVTFSYSSKTIYQPFFGSRFLTWSSHQSSVSHDPCAEIMVKPESRWACSAFLNLDLWLSPARHRWLPGPLPPASTDGQGGGRDWKRSRGGWALVSSGFVLCHHIRTALSTTGVWLTFCQCLVFFLRAPLFCFQAGTSLLTAQHPHFFTVKMTLWDACKKQNWQIADT